MKKYKSYDIHTNGDLILQKLQIIYDSTINLVKKEIHSLKVNIDNSMINQIKKVSTGIIETSKDSLNSIIAETIKSYPVSLHSSNWVEIPVEDLLIEDEVKIPKLIEIDQNKGVAPWDISEISPLSRNRLISLPN